MVKRVVVKGFDECLREGEEMVRVNDLRDDGGRNRGRWEGDNGVDIGDGGDDFLIGDDNGGGGGR